MNLKKFGIKGLPRFAKLIFDPDTYTVQLCTGRSDKNSKVEFEKVIRPDQLKKLKFKIPQVPGFMFRILSGKIYIREEV